MKIYRHRWWHDRDRVTALVALGVLLLLWAVVMFVVFLAIARGCESRPAPPTPEQVLPAPREGKEELRAKS